MKWNIKIFEQFHTSRDENFYVEFPVCRLGRHVINKKH